MFSSGTLNFPANQDLMYRIMKVAAHWMLTSKVSLLIASPLSLATTTS
jgi:hypothetical protein